MGGGQQAAALRVALAGCGDASQHYAAGIRAESRLELAGAFDVDVDRLTAFAGGWGGRAYRSLDELLTDQSVDVVVNLTSPRRHHAVTSACLRSGKHVHSEKPLAMTVADCDELIGLASAAGVSLSVSPFVQHGAAQQVVGRLLREGACGTVRMVYAEVNQGRIERRHPAPERVYDVGPLWDVGVYPLAIATAFLGPASHATAVSRRLLPARVRPDGGQFDVGPYDWLVAVVDLRCGAAVRVTCSLYVGTGWRRVVQFHGDEASLQLDDHLDFASPVTLLSPGRTPSPVPVPGDPPRGVPWAWPLTELADALAEGRAHRAGPEHARHVVEIMCAIEASARLGQPVEIRSSF
jgi:predicted dehydrogenase